MENQITSGIKAAVTISQAELAELVMKTARRLDFELANEPLRMIKWWNSDQQGSVLVKGRYQYQPAVMKLQMVPAITKESWIMRQVSKLMSNLGVRPPRLYRVGELGEGRGEVLIMEAV